MTHASADRATGVANGLSQAHRLWFGLPHEVTPLDRPDLAPAGFLMASASDLGRFVAAQVDGGTLDGRRILSASATAEMQQGVTAMGLGDPGRYGLGWADGSLGDVRMVGHVGSTTDMASAVFFSPEQRFGVVLLLNGQSTLYELAHKPDLIGMAAFALLAGREPDGTIGFLYPAFDAAAVLLLGWIAWRLRPDCRGGCIVASRSPRACSATCWLGVIVAVWLNAIIPFELFLLVPNLLAAPWTSLVRIDLGQVLFGFALLRLATGVILAIAAGRVIRARWSARAARIGRVTAG